MSFDKNKSLSKAQKLIQQGKLAKAVEEFQLIVENDPSDIRTLLKIGDLSAKLGNIEVATDTYKKVAEHYAKDGFFLKAIAVFKQILKLDPGVINVYTRLAELYNQLGLNSEAMKQYQIVVKHYENKGMKKESLDVLKKMAELDPDNVASKIKLAELYLKEGYKDQAVSQFGTVAKELKDKHNYEDLIKVLEKMVALNPLDHENVKELSSIYLKVGEPKKALAKLQACFKANPKDALTLELLAQSFVDLQQPEKAKSVYMELVAVYESNGMIEEKDQIVEKMKAILPDESFQVSASSLSGVGSSAAGQAPGGEELLLSDEASARQEDEGKESASKILSEVDVYLKYGLMDKAVENLIRGLESIDDKVPILNKLAAFIKSEGSKAAALKALETACRNLSKAGKNDILALVEKARGTPAKPVSAVRQQVEVKQEEIVEEVEEEVLVSDDSLVKVGDEIAFGEPEQSLGGLDVDLGIAPAEVESKPKQKVEVHKADKVSKGPQIEFPEDLSPEKPASIEISDSLEKEMLRQGEVSDSLELSSFEIKPEKEKEKIPQAEPGFRLEEKPKVSLPAVKYKDELEEADFFVKQGLLEEAKYIYESIVEAEPGFMEAKEKLEEINGLLIKDSKSKISRPRIESAPEGIASRQESPGGMAGGGDLFDLGRELAGEIQEINKALTTPPEEQVLTFEEMFSQFKKGVEKSLAKDDYQSHYDLGLAYREMGLLDDAIAEFKTSMMVDALKNKSIGMIGICFHEKGNYENAIKTFEMGISIVGRETEEGLSFLFDMAESHYKNGQIDAALTTFREIKGKKSGFRNVMKRITEVEASLAEKAKAHPKGEGSKLPDIEESDDNEDKGEEDSDKKSKISYI